MRKTLKSKVLKEIEITEYPQLLLLGYQYASATFIDFMGTIKSADFRKFEDSLMSQMGLLSKLPQALRKTTY